MRKFMTSIFIVLTMTLFGSALSSSADEYYYYDSNGRLIERHRDSGFGVNFITPSNPFDGDRVYYYDDDHDHDRYYYYERDYDDDDDIEFKLDIL